MILFGDRGVPDSWRHMHAYSGHTFKLVQASGEFVYAQFHYLSDQGTGFHTQEESVKISGENPDSCMQDLFESIENKQFPSWTLYIQTMTVEQAEKFRYNILDLTKVWPHQEFPLRPVGKLVLNENIQNYFAEIEQIAFSPSHTIRGIEPTADPVLQSRLFSYPDTHRHRIGPNYNQLPINAPIHPPSNFQRDGPMAFYNQGNRPNYQSPVRMSGENPESCEKNSLSRRSALSLGVRHSPQSQLRALCHLTSFDTPQCNRLRYKSRSVQLSIVVTLVPAQPRRPPVVSPVHRQQHDPPRHQPKHCCERVQREEARLCAEPLRDTRRTYCVSQSPLDERNTAVGWTYGLNALGERARRLVRRLAAVHTPFDEVERGSAVEREWRTVGPLLPVLELLHARTSQVSSSPRDAGPARSRHSPLYRQ